ncbi:MAG: two-component regulator propeller domain-containing protein [Bacteroidota bacterium]|nr:two-component regulator propeller domain-containing protein [Bacteroidota bacterium]
MTNHDGLSSIYVFCIAQDDLGFMWFGTQDGLNKYDGYQVKVFKNDPTNPNSLSSSDITCIKQLRRDLILIGTREGLNFFNPITEKFTAINNIKGLDVKINCIAKFDSLNAIIGSDNGLFLVNLITKKVDILTFPIDDKVSVKSILCTKNRYYLGTKEKGLWVINKRKLERVNLIKPEYLSFNLEELDAINDMKEYAGKLYIGSKENGIFKIDLNNNEIEEKITFLSDTKNSNSIRRMDINNNKIYAATGNGFVIYNLLSKKYSLAVNNSKETSISNNLLRYVFVDKDENIWLGTEMGGVDVSFKQTQKFPQNDLDEDYVLKNIYSFLEFNSNCFVGGENLLKQYNTTSKKEMGNLVKILEGNYALSIFKEDENVLWVGTYGKGLIRYDSKTKKSLKVLNEKLGGTILNLKSNSNYLYACSVGDGLFEINLKTLEFKNYSLNEGLPSPSINTMFKDSKNNIWLGMIDGGLVKLKDFPNGKKLEISQIYKNDKKRNQIASNTILALNEDKNGVIWVATSAGLSKLYPNNTFVSFYEKDGLPNTYLYSILKDSLNQFWMSSNNGIIRFNPSLPEKEIIFKHYTAKDGLANTEYNIGAAYLSEKGTMYFGGANGFNAFNPNAIKDNLTPAKTYIVSYKRSGKDVEIDSLINYKKHLKLSWRENYFQFEVVALDYTDPSKNKFSYKLEGYDNDWSAPTNVRYISYTELPGGEYTLKIKASNNDGIWNENPYEINITVVPPFWKTTWFYVLVGIFGSAGVIAFTQYRTRAIKKENKILENKVAERTKELAEKNKDITSSIEYAKRIQEAILPSKEVIFKKLQKAFILYKPKDIVSGDFYWFAEKNGFNIFAVVDCTGHGVPGAFMSMIGHNLLHQIVLEKGVTEPGEILNNLHKGVQESLRQGQNEINTNDGMDVSLIAVNYKDKIVKWAGANRPLVLINSVGEYLKFDGNKFPVGGAQLDINRQFTTHQINVTNAMAYMFSDGYADQFGGEKGKKYMVKRFNDLLSVIYHTSPENQRSELEKSFEQWKINHEQVDDVLVVGIGI